MLRNSILFLAIIILSSCSGKNESSPPTESNLTGCELGSMGEELIKNAAQATYLKLEEEKFNPRGHGCSLSAGVVSFHLVETLLKSRSDAKISEAVQTGEFAQFVSGFIDSENCLYKPVSIDLIRKITKCKGIENEK